MLYDILKQEICRVLPFEPTFQQAEAIESLSRFLVSPVSDAAFILRGYAGTGKTSLVSAIVRMLNQIHRTVVLLAPTGRAAKVFSAYAGQPAYTIHKAIYRQRTFTGEDTAFNLGYNKLRHALFIVDEASMIANQGFSGARFGSGMLLDDLIRYVFEGEGCKLLLVGDTAQLPPVGEEDSPALSVENLCSYGLRVSHYDLTEVVRQAASSGVLWNATRLRCLLSEGNFQLPQIHARHFPDISFMPGNELVESLEQSYRQCGTSDTIVITLSNKRAIVYNNGIRTRIFDRESELTKGDMIMAVKNNYFWTEQEARHLEKDEHLPFDFIANGDVAEVRHISNVHEMHGFRFADATLCFHDYEDYEMTCRVLLDTLQAEAPSLTHEQSNRLFENVLADYADIPQRRERFKKLRQDPYYNALQIKYAYAVTCHKAQGGQWRHVYIDQGYLGDNVDTSYLRWLYTAFTRTTEKLYLVNWPENQQGEEDKS